MTATSVSLDPFAGLATAEPIARADLDPLATRAASGDREAEERLSRHFAGNVVAWVEELARKSPSLARRKADLVQDGMRSLVGAIRRFKAGEGKAHLPAWVKRNVMPDLKKAAMRWRSDAGLCVPDGGRSAADPEGRKHKVDFALPAFRASAGDVAESRAAASGEATDPRVGPRWRMKLLMRRLNPFEKVVVGRIGGFPIHRPTCSPWTFRDSMHTDRDPVEAIAREYEVPAEEVRSTHRAALEKMAAPTRDGHKFAGREVHGNR